MPARTLYSIIESPTHPRYSNIYQANGLLETRCSSMRQAMSQIKKDPPDYIAAEFFYGYGNNYAGVNISNLDVMLFSLQRYAPEARVIVFVDKSERQYVDALIEIFPLYRVFTYPVAEEELNRCLQAPDA